MVPDAGRNGCRDDDGDGYGEGCALGNDCDDSNSSQTGIEVCDGQDNDCDGEADNGVLSPCGDCNPMCDASGTGVGSENPFTPDDSNSEGVGLDDEGAVILDSRMINTDFIWISNTGQGTVSRFSTRAPYEEVGRYFSGPAPEGDREDGNDPSRTSVNSSGDVYVGNRDRGTVSRISILGDACPDTNGDGSITTSSDENFLPWGQDDCVLWHTDLNTSKVRAVAAQDVYGADGELREYVWVGSWDDRRVYKLDGATGQVLLETESPVPTYGFALDGLGNLWISGWSSGDIARIDTNRCTDNASCDTTICDSDGVDCVKQRIDAPDRCYGITVDFNQRVWCGGDLIMRYQPTLPSGMRWDTVLPWDGASAGDLNTHGIAADASGWVYAAGSSDGVVRVDGETMETHTVAGTDGANNKGMAVDSDGKVWSITRGSEAIVITPGATIDAYTVERGIAASIVGPYTYSDMTGLQLRLATNPRGHYRSVFEGCPEDVMGATEWSELRWEVETPAGTSVQFRVKTADTRAALDTATWVNVSTVPSDVSPADLATALAGAGVPIGRWMMVEAQLISDRNSPREVITPRLLSVDVTFICPSSFG